MDDTITVLKCSDSMSMTKTWQNDGTLCPYDSAAIFRVVTKPVTSIRELHSLLERLQRESQCCVIRGAFVGKEQANSVCPPEKPGYFRRNNQLFDEIPHHWLMIDIDGYRPRNADPVLEPVKAIDEYIATRLPAAFQGISYSWQLSASAGAPNLSRILKAHIWFWLVKPYTGPELTAWARATGAELDVSVLRRVQPHYTAAPLFAPGITDPVPVRIGFEAGWSGDEVDLLIDSDVLAGAKSFAADSELELTDPKTKPGLIGAFCQAFDMNEVITRWLPDVFEFQEGSERRMNFLRGGGSPGGAFLSECREYVINMHNSDPLLGRAANKWDLVRWYVFGHLDENKDAIELLDVASRPSHIAMQEMVKTLPEVNALAVRRQAEHLEDWRAQMAAASDDGQLREIATRLAKDRQLDSLSREQVISSIKQRFADLGQKVGVGVIRKMVAGTGNNLASNAMSAEAPDWAKPWVYVTDCDKFFNLSSKEKVTEQGFNARYTRQMAALADPRSGKFPAASRHCLDHWNLPCVAHLAYLPTAGALFETLGLTWANLYNPASAPALETCDEAVAVVQNHLERMLPDTRERDLFTSWLAHNVQFPGVKIRWAPYLHGFEGDGKSFFLDLLATTMGAGNVRTVSGSTLESSFTDWAVGYAVTGIEEMKQHGHNRYDVMNRLKPYITNATVEIHPKGKASYVAPNTSNYVILSNYLDGAPIHETDRRYFFLSSAIDADDLPKLNSDGYFTKLFEVLAKHSGALRQWLLSYALTAEFDANGRAPETTTKAAVLELTRSETETVAQDIIEMGAVGIHARVLSSNRLAKLIKAELGDEAKVTTTQVNTLLAKLGYRFLDRKHWNGDKHRVWVKGTKLTWNSAKALLDSTTLASTAGAGAGY